ncbi:MAG: DUF1707 domain-containing protein [Actinobacteria bacterium]|nr:DUF1707 domain-containing protein [Actinomycetota bacterium]
MLERPPEPTPSAALPSDDDRDRAVAVLRSHCADGRLTLDEFADKVVGVLQARSQADIEAVVGESLDRSGVAVPEAESEPACGANWVVGIMWGAQRRGRWRPRRRVNAFAFWGGCTIDFRGAELVEPEVRVTAVAMMGGIDIIVPEGVAVEVTSVPIMGGVGRRIRDVPILPGTPVIKVRAVAFWGGVTVRSKPSRSNEARALGHHDRRLGRPRDDESLDRVAASVQRERPDLSADAPPDGTVTILFSDIENFTSMTERLGDIRAQDVLRAHNELVRTQVAAWGGHEVKSQGDSFMISFGGARRGIRCAMAIQRAFEEWSVKHPDNSLRVRIGLHTGEAIREEDDLFGRSVIMAARIAAHAGGGEILVSSLLKELAEASGEFRFGPPHCTALKGLSGEHLLYPVVWQQAGDAVPDMA